MIVSIEAEPYNYAVLGRSLQPFITQSKYGPMI